MDEVAADEFAEQIGLHAAVARSIALHHGVGGRVGAAEQGTVASTGRSTTAMQPLQAKTGARYAVFI